MVAVIGSAFFSIIAIDGIGTAMEQRCTNADFTLAQIGIGTWVAIVA